MQLLHLHIYVKIAVVKSLNSITLVCDGNVKIECKYQTKLNFAQIMGAPICICKARKVFSSEPCIKLQLNRSAFLAASCTL